MPTYRLHDHAGDDLGLLEHPAPNLEPGDVVVLQPLRDLGAHCVDIERPWQGCRVDLKRLCQPTGVAIGFR